MELEARNAPPALFPGLRNCTTLYTGLRNGIRTGVMVLDCLFVWPPMERRGEFAAANLQAESYLEREHNARWLRLASRTPQGALRPIY